MYQEPAAYAHESHTTVECYKQTPVPMVCSALEHGPPSLCAEAYHCAASINNRLPHSAIYEITSWEALCNGKLSISQLRPLHTKYHS